MGNWSSIDANQLLPSSVVSTVHALADLANTVLGEAKVALAAVESVPSLPDLPNPAAAAATALLNALEALLTGAKIQTIIIPIAKIPPVPAPARLPATIDNLQQWLDINLGPAADTSGAYQRLVAGTAGNAGFYRTFAQSLFDPADPNRPQYLNQSDAVAMVVMLAGASSYSSIAQAASLFDQLLKPKGAIGSFDARLGPVPLDVTAKPVIAANGGTIAVKVEWTAPPPLFSFPYFPGLAISAKRYAVLRLIGPASPSVRTVLDVFSTQDLVEGMTNAKGTVVTIGTATNSSYLDKTPPPTDGSPVYYCVAWETTVVEPSGTTTGKFDRVSTVAKVMQVAPPPAQTGSPPNWTAFGTAADAFPPIANVMQLLLERAKLLAGGSPSGPSRLASALQTAAAMADRLEARATDLMTDVDRLAASLSRPLPSLHVTQMSSGTGGNAFLLSELAKRLGDTADLSRPPFDNGEYVCGVCFVAGAPRLADLASALAFFEALFGPAAPTNPLMNIITAIETAVSAAEAATFDPGMRPTTNPVVPAPRLPVISDGGVPVAASDPLNPAQGNTNNKPLSELC